MSNLQHISKNEHVSIHEPELHGNHFSNIFIHVDLYVSQSKDIEDTLVTCGASHMNNNDHDRDYSLRSEVLHELERINDSVSESLTILTSTLDGEPSPFFLIPYIIEHFVWGDPRSSNVFKKRNAYLLFLWEALETLRVSVLLTLGFRYATGLTLLRQSLETLIRGAFVDTIAQKEYRSKRTVKGLKIGQFLDNLFAQMLKDGHHLSKIWRYHHLYLLKHFRNIKWRRVVGGNYQNFLI